MGVLRHLRPLRLLLALLIGPLLASGCDLETCDDATYQARCDGRTAVICPSDNLLPFSFLHRMPCEEGCVVEGRDAACVDEPLTPCEDHRCEGDRYVYCQEVGSRSYESTSDCGEGEVCRDGACVAP